MLITPSTLGALTNTLQRYSVFAESKSGLLVTPAPMGSVSRIVSRTSGHRALASRSIRLEKGIRSSRITSLGTLSTSRSIWPSALSRQRKTLPVVASHLHSPFPDRVLSVANALSLLIHLTL